jgi:hypothetical protein
MIQLDDFLYSLFRENKITYQDMMEKAVNPEELQQKVTQQVVSLKSQVK